MPAARGRLRLFARKTRSPVTGDAPEASDRRLHKRT
jgi:hypothetical protein